MEENNDKKEVVSVEQFAELQAQFSKLNELVEAKDSSIKALEQNNKNLIDEKRAEETKVETERQAKMSSEGQHAELLAERQTAWDLEKSELASKLETMSNQFHGLTGESVLNASLTNVGVNPALMPGAEAIFRSTWKFDDKGSPQHDGKALADSIRDWAGTDVGKAFLLSDNSGSGAKPTASTKTKQTSDVSKMTEDQLLEAAENGTLPDAGNTWT